MDGLGQWTNSMCVSVSVFFCLHGCVLVICVCAMYVCIFHLCVCVSAARLELTRLPSCQRCLNFLNNLITGIICLTFIINIVKSAFGTQRSCLLRWLFQRFIL